MTVIDDLTPKKYRPVRMIIEIAPDPILREDSLTFCLDVRILNEKGAPVGDDHPQPASTTLAQKTTFLAWIKAALDDYEVSIGLVREGEL